LDHISSIAQLMDTSQRNALYS